jgi:hypothetical protein
MSFFSFLGKGPGQPQVQPGLKAPQSSFFSMAQPPQGGIQLDPATMASHRMDPAAAANLSKSSFFGQGGMGRSIGAGIASGLAQGLGQSQGPDVAAQEQQRRQQMLDAWRARINQMPQQAQEHALGLFNRISNFGG